MIWTPYWDTSVADGPELPVWAIAPGLPSLHVVRAALHAASVLDHQGSRLDDARESYWRRATGGLFPVADLRKGETLLVDCGLVLERDGVLIPTEDLQSLLDGTVEDAVECVAAMTIAQNDPAWLIDQPGTAPEALESLIPDPQRREELLLALGRRFDDSHQRLIGDIGEELVVIQARLELEEMGHYELARRVRRVSLESDHLGYDVSAPRVSAPARLMEVKSSTSATTNIRGVHLTRNEAEIGTRYPSDWTLVFCQITDYESRQGQIFGWCSRIALDPFLPVDVVSQGRWEQAWLEIPADLFTPGLPRASA